MGLFYNAPEPTRGLSLANNVENIDRGEVCACTSMTPKSTRPFLRGGGIRGPHLAVMVPWDPSKFSSETAPGPSSQPVWGPTVVKNRRIHTDRPRYTRSNRPHLIGRPGLRKITTYRNFEKRRYPIQSRRRQLGGSAWQDCP